MSTVGPLLVGLVAGAVALHLLRPVIESPILRRTNFRGRMLPTAGGLAGVVGATVAIAVWWLVEPDRPLWLPLVPVLGFGLLGFVDDILAAGPDRGFAGHVLALGHGRLTTGGLKLVGGAAVGVVTALQWDGGDRWRVVVDALLLALAANLGNLLDRRPGRTLKVGALLAVVLGVIGRHRHYVLTGPTLAAGAFLALIRADLREELMLGDTGANAMGGVLGLGVLVTVPFRWRLVVLVVLLALNALSEVVSFSEVIDRVAPLRWVDRAGRAPG